MTSLHAPRSWSDPDPAPMVPTPDEIEFADEIRHRLESRLLSQTEWPTRQFGAMEYDWAVRYEE